MRLASVFLSAMLLLLFASEVHAQRSQATLVGTVKDASGAAVPSAKVTLKSLDTGAVLNRTTDESGNYTISGLQVGHYSLTVSMARFKTVTIPDIELQVGQSRRHRGLTPQSNRRERQPAEDRHSRQYAYAERPQSNRRERQPAEDRHSRQLRLGEVRQSPAATTAAGVFSAVVGAASVVPDRFEKRIAPSRTTSAAAAMP